MVGTFPIYTLLMKKALEIAAFASLQPPCPLTYLFLLCFPKLSLPLPPSRPLPSVLSPIFLSDKGET